MKIEKSVSAIFFAASTIFATNSYGIEKLSCETFHAAFSSFKIAESEDLEIALGLGAPARAEDTRAIIKAAFNLDSLAYPVTFLKARFSKVDCQFKSNSTVRCHGIPNEVTVDGIKQQLSVLSFELSRVDVSRPTGETLRYYQLDTTIDVNGHTTSASFSDESFTCMSYQ